MNFQYQPPKMTYNDNTSHALSYLLRDGLGHAEMSECIYRVEADIKEASFRGVLLRNVVSGAYLMSADSTSEQQRLIGLLPEDVQTVYLHRPSAVDLLQDRFPAAKAEALTLWRFPGFEPPRFPLPFEVWPLDAGDIEASLNCDPEIDENVLTFQISRKLVYGACINDEVGGTVGTGPDGNITFLSVRPDLRGQGVGKTLLLWMLRRELRSGHVPFLFTDEAHAGLAPLLTGVGLEQAPDPVFRCQIE